MYEKLCQIFPSGYMYMCVYVLAIMMHGGNILQQLCNSKWKLDYSCKCDDKRLVMLSSFCWMLVSLFSSEDTCAWSLAISSNLRGRKDIGVSYNGVNVSYKRGTDSHFSPSLYLHFCKFTTVHWLHKAVVDKYTCIHKILTFLLVFLLCLWMCPHSCVGPHHTPALTASQYCHPSPNILILHIQRKGIYVTH